jgi:hypothetical protein
MTTRFKKAYDALVRAFFEGTLAKGTCVACACGNIIFDAIGDPVTKEDLSKEIEFSGLSLRSGKKDSYNAWSHKRGRIDGKFRAFCFVENEINAAGYTAKEFARIENAFENNTKISYGSYPNRNEQQILEDQYKGLCAVVDVLLELDGEEFSGEELKNKFKEHPKLLIA